MRKGVVLAYSVIGSTYLMVAIAGIFHIRKAYHQPLSISLGSLATQAQLCKLALFSLFCEISRPILEAADCSSARIDLWLLSSGAGYWAYVRLSAVCCLLWVSDQVSTKAVESSTFLKYTQKQSLLASIGLASRRAMLWHLSSLSPWPPLHGYHCSLCFCHHPGNASQL